MVPGGNDNTEKKINKLEVLTQEEINQLLDAINGKVNDEKADDDDDSTPSEESRKIKIWDFKRPERFTKEQIETIENIHESFAESCSELFSRHLQEKIHIKLLSVDDRLFYDEFVKSVPTPVLLLIAQGVFNSFPITVPFGIAIDANIYKEYMQLQDLPDFTCIDNFHELELLERIATSNLTRLLLEEYSHILSKRCKVKVDLQFKSIGTSFQNINNFSKEEMCTSVDYEVNTPNGGGIINILLPYQFLRHLFPFLSRKNHCTENMDSGSNNKLIEQQTFKSLSGGRYGDRSLHTNNRRRTG